MSSEVIVESDYAIDEKPHRKLKVWQASMDFVVDLYKASEFSGARKIWTHRAIATCCCIDSQQQLKDVRVEVPGNYCSSCISLEVR